MAKNLKSGMMRVINMGESAHVGDVEGKKCPPAASFHLNLMLLEQVEKEARRRNMDPTGPDFGHDLMSEIVEIKVSLLTG